MSQKSHHKHVADVFDFWVDAVTDKPRLPLLMVTAARGVEEEAYVVVHASRVLPEEVAVLMLDEIRHSLLDQIAARPPAPVGSRKK